MKRHIQGIIESLGSVGFVKAFLTFAFFSVLISQTNNILIDTALNSLFALEFLRENNIERTKFIIMEKIKCIEFDDDNRKEKINFLKNKIYCKKNFKKLFSHILGNLRVVKNLTEGLKLTAEREKREYIVTLDGILIERSGLITGGGISSKYFFFSKQKINLNWLGKYACVFLQFQCFKFLAKFTQTSQNFYEKKNLISHFFLEKNLDFSQSFLFFIFYFNTKIFEKKKKEKKKKANKFFMIFKKKTSEIYFKKKKKCEKKKYSLNIWAKNIFCIISIFFLEKFFFRKRFIQKKTICDFFFDQFFFDKKQKHSLIKLDFFLTVIYKKEQTNKKKKKEDFRIQTFCFFFYLFVKFNNILLSIIKIELGSLLRMVFDLRFIIDHKIYAYLADKKFSQNPRNFFFGFKKKKKRLKIEAKKVFWFSKQVEGFSLFSFFFILKKNLYKKKLILKKNIFETNTWGFKQILSYFYSTSINFFFQNENSISIFLHFSFFFFFLGKIFAIRSKFIKICRFLIKKILNATKNSHVHFQRLFEYLRYFLDFKENLRTIFPNFYQGGILEVNLIDPLDPFSEGVVLSVKPPGKTWKSVLYLSGGEKTLSSLAFVFSLQNLQKVSWYLLDEIDAALDYKNVEIISKYFNLYSSYQILIISLRNNMFMGTNHALGVYKIFSGTKTVILKNQKYLL